MSAVCQSSLSSARGDVAGQPRHLDVEDDASGWVRKTRLHGLDAVLGGDDGEAGALEHGGRRCGAAWGCRRRSARWAWAAPSSVGQRPTSVGPYRRVRPGRTRS